MFFFIITFPLTKGKSNKEPWTRPDPGSKTLKLVRFSLVKGMGDPKIKVFDGRFIFEG